MTIDGEQADLSAYVLTLLDDHLRAMRDIRERMRTGGTTAAGARHTLALDSITAAEIYAVALRRVLVRAAVPVP
jgi:hypothetical protein